MTSQSLKPRFIVLQRGQVISTHEIDPGQEWSLGRQSGCAIVIQHPSISRRHARAFCDISGVRIEDLKTANGTYVNDRRVEGVVSIRSGDVIRLGQTKATDPIVIKYEDPSMQLLEALTDDEKSGSRRAADSGALSAPPAATPPPVPGAASALAKVEGPTLPTLAESPTSEKPPSLIIRIIKEPRIWIPVAAAVALAVTFGIWFATGLRGTQSAWKSIRVEPMKVRAGYRMTLLGPEITAGTPFSVTVGTAQAKIEESVAGRLAITIPDLDVTEVGVTPIPIRVEHRGIILFQQPIQYEAVPKVRTISPSPAAVGQVIELAGSGFTTEVARVQVKLGQMPAEIVSATASLIRARVPLLTRGPVVHVPVEVRIAEWASDPVMLDVGPRDTSCYKMVFTAAYVGERVWEIRAPLGALLYLEGSAPAAGPEIMTPPRSVAQATQTLDMSFERAQTDPTVRFEIRESGATPTLVVAGASVGNGKEVGRWTPQALSYVKARAQFPGEAVMIPYWNIVVLNEVLNLFGKAQQPVTMPATSVVRTTLQKLFDRNVAAGGRGCPSADEINALTPQERDQFQAASWDLPENFGEVAGVWTGEVQGVFATTTDEEVKQHLRLDLRQSGTSLSGTVTIEEVRPQGIRWSPPSSPGVHGRLKLGSQVRVDISMPAIRPFNIIRLTGVITGDTIDGTFTTSAGVKGACSLSRAGG